MNPLLRLLLLQTFHRFLLLPVISHLKDLPSANLLPAAAAASAVDSLIEERGEKQKIADL